MSNQVISEANELAEQTKLRNAGIAQHPKYFGAKVNSDLKLPGDTRLFRDIKLYEIPQWILKRDFSPLGIYFTMKRWRHGYMSKYVLGYRGFRGNWFAQLTAVSIIAGYIGNFDYLRRTAMRRKYH